MPSSRIYPPGCINLPCISWLNWKPDMFFGGTEFRELSENMDKRMLNFDRTRQTTKKPKEQSSWTIKKSEKTMESSKDRSNGEIRVRNAVRGGRDNGIPWQSPLVAPISRSTDFLFRNDQQQFTTDIYDNDPYFFTVPVQNQNSSQSNSSNMPHFPVPVQNQNSSQSNSSNKPHFPIQNQNIFPGINPNISTAAVQNQTEFPDTGAGISTTSVRNQNKLPDIEADIPTTSESVKTAFLDTAPNILPVPVQNQTAFPDSGQNIPTVPAKNQNVSQKRTSEESIQIRPHSIEISRVSPSFQDQLNPQVTSIEPNIADIKLNRNAVKESPLIQVYVIASGSGGAHTNIGGGGYHGSHNGQSNVETSHLKSKVPKNIEEQKANVDTFMTSIRHFQESRKRNPWIFDHQTGYKNPVPTDILNSKREVEGTLANIYNKYEKKFENEELVEDPAAPGDEVIQEVLSGIITREFQNHQIMQK